MRAALWLVALFGVAVAVALFAGNNQAVVTLFWPPHRVDISFNLLVLLVLGLLALLHLALKALGAIASLPAQARRWRAQQKERAMYAAFMDALGHLLAGRFIRASRAAENALLQEKGLGQLASEVGLDSGYHPSRLQQLRSLAHLLAAESAHALQNKTLRQEHVQQAVDVAAGRNALQSQDGIQLRAARWALDDRDPQRALEALALMPQGAGRRTLALRLRLRAARLARHTEDALETARLLAKHRAFSAPAAQSIVRGLALDLLNAAHDTDQIRHAWLSLEEAERNMPELASAAAERLVMLGGDAALARQWLAGPWERMLSADASVSDALRLKYIAALVASLDSLDAAWLSRIEAALQLRPGDASLEYLAGMACLKRQLWGKAQQLLSHAVLSLQDSALKRRAWCALAELAEQRSDSDAAFRAYREAAKV